MGTHLMVAGNLRQIKLIKILLKHSCKLFHKQLTSIILRMLFVVFLRLAVPNDNLDVGFYLILAFAGDKEMQNVEEFTRWFISVSNITTKIHKEHFFKSRYTLHLLTHDDTLLKVYSWYARLHLKLCGCSILLGRYLSFEIITMHGFIFFVHTRILAHS